VNEDLLWLFELKRGEGIFLGSANEAATRQTAAETPESGEPFPVKRINISSGEDACVDYA
jgi:hypothetical protein